MTEHTTGTREDWKAAIDELRKREAELAELGREIAEQRRALPWVPVEKEYVFDTEDGPRTLGELFDGRSQLVAYNLMYGPDYTKGACPGCTSLADQFDGGVIHLNHRDVTFMAISRAPLADLQAYKKRMGWSFPWVSSYGNDYGVDFEFLMTDEKMQESDEAQEMLKDPPDWLQEWSEQVGAPLEVGLREGPGWIVFALADGVVHHTYSRPPPDGVVPYYYQHLDQAPKGRGEEFRATRKDEY